MLRLILFSLFDAAGVAFMLFVLANFHLDLKGSKKTYKRRRSARSVRSPSPASVAFVTWRETAAGTAEFCATGNGNDDVCTWCVHDMHARAHAHTHAALGRFFKAVSVTIGP